MSCIALVHLETRMYLASTKDEDAAYKTCLDFAGVSFVILHDETLAEKERGWILEFNSDYPDLAPEHLYDDFFKQRREQVQSALKRYERENEFKRFSESVHATGLPLTHESFVDVNAQVEDGKIISLSPAAQ